MKLWQKFKFGIFDADGTLFDNMETSADAFLKVIKDFKLQGASDAVRKIYLETNGMNLNDQFKLFFDNNGVGYNNALIGNLNKEFFDLRDNWEKWQNAPLFPGTKSVLQNLKENGVKIFISSGSNTDEVIFRLKKTEIMEYFGLVLGGEKTPKGQKHIDLFAKFCGLSPKNFASQAFFTSDGPNDMTLAKNAGIFAIGISNTVNIEKLSSAGADLIVSNLNALAKLEF